jgi:DNA-binding NtrC family response regulator
MAMTPGKDYQEPAAAARPAILVVDDEPAVRLLLEAGLRQQGYAVLLAATGEEALEVFQRQRGAIHLVLLDVRLPGRDGPATLAALQAVDAQVRCCFLTGDLGGYTEEDLRQRGALKVFYKPFDLPRLVQFVVQAGNPATLPDQGPTTETRAVPVLKPPPPKEPGG